MPDFLSSTTYNLTLLARLHYRTTPPSSMSGTSQKHPNMNETHPQMQWLHALSGNWSQSKHSKSALISQCYTGILSAYQQLC